MSERPNSDRIGIAFDIAKDLEARGLSGPDATLILAMALGIFCEGTEGHREMRPLLQGMLKAAQLAPLTVCAKADHEHRGQDSR